MISWATFPFVRYTPVLIAGIVAYLQWGAAWPPLWPLTSALVLLAALLTYVARRRPATTDAAGLFSLLVVAWLSATLTQQAVEARRPDHISHFAGPIEAYRAVVSDYTVSRPSTFATTLRVQAVRVGGRWLTATGGVRISLPRAAGVAAPAYGQVWLVRGHPDRSKAPLNPGEFDYRRYLEYRQVYHQQFIHPDQYRVLGMAPPSYVVALSMRAARALDGVFRHYIRSTREYALASALVLGIKDEVDLDTRQAYANTGTTHIMAVSGLQVGLLFAALSWGLRRLFAPLRGFRYWSAAVGLAVIWSYAFLTGGSASVLRATVMFSFIIVGRAAGRQDSIFNTLAVAAFALLCYDPFLVADVGFQLSFLAVLSIVYLQPPHCPLAKPGGVLPRPAPALAAPTGAGLVARPGLAGRADLAGHGIVAGGAGSHLPAGAVLLPPVSAQLPVFQPGGGAHLQRRRVRGAGPAGPAKPGGRAKPTAARRGGRGAGLSAPGGGAGV
jgi:competence protein ComEC